MGCLRNQSASCPLRERTRRPQCVQPSEQKKKTRKLEPLSVEKANESRSLIVHATRGTTVKNSDATRPAATTDEKRVNQLRHVALLFRLFFFCFSTRESSARKGLIEFFVFVLLIIGTRLRPRRIGCQVHGAERRPEETPASSGSAQRVRRRP